jgi:ADP-ribosyltransferase exoenzyme
VRLNNPELASLHYVPEGAGDPDEAMHVGARTANPNVSTLAEQSIRSYGGSAYGPVNEMLREAAKPGYDRSRTFNPDKLERLAFGVHEAISKQKPLEEAIEVWRGVGGGWADVAEVGRTYTHHSFASTSYTERVAAERFASFRGDLLQIYAPKGARGVDMNATEFVLPAGTKLRIDSIGPRTDAGGKGGGGRLIKARIVL